MSFFSLIGDSPRTKSSAKRGSARRRSLRFESLEERALLTTVNSFADLQSVIAAGQDDVIDLGSDIVVQNAGDMITLSAGNFTINGNGKSITSAASSRSAVLFYVTGGSLTLNNLTISGFSYSAGTGSIFRQSGGTINVGSGTTISNCLGNNGGVGNITGGTFTVGSDAANDSEVLFSGNNAVSGGVFCVTSTGTLTIDHGTFRSNTASQGGVLRVAGASASADINGGVFNSNRASGSDSSYGGVLNADNQGTVTIDGGTFSGNSATGGGGAFFTNNGAVTVSDGTISNNTSGTGGAVLVWSGGFTVSGGTFQSNNADSHGGAIYTKNEGVRITVTGGTFDSNKASGCGGVVYAFNQNNNISISNATLKNNEAKNGGVVFFEKTGTLSFTNATVQSNKVTEFGGVAYTRKGTFTVTGGEFTGNSAKNGGVFYATAGGTLTINSGTFGKSGTGNGNSAANGGVLYLHGATANISGGTFGWNTASTCGGFCYATNHDEDDTDDGNVTVNLTGGTFTSNSALYGGVVYLDYNTAAPSYSATLNLGAVTMENNNAINGGAIGNHGGTVADASTAIKTFTGNSAKYNIGTDEDVWVGNGGAIFNTEKGSVTLSNAVFTDNYCVGNGGAIDNMTNSYLTLTGARFSGNSALGSATLVDNIDWASLTSDASDGGAIQNWGTATLVNAYFTGNSAHDGGAIANGAGATLKLSQTTGSTDGAPLGFAGNGAVYGGAIINVGELTRTSGDQNVAIEFTENSSYNNGGAISNSDDGGRSLTGSLNMYGLSFTDNTAGDADNGHTGNGGAIISAKPLTISTSTFTGNSASSGASIGGKGGAIDQVAGTLLLNADVLTNNDATNIGFGGAVNTWVGGTITDCAFAGNSAKNGGAVSVLGNTKVTKIDHTGSAATSFSGNSATFGGAVYASGEVEINGASFNNNSATLGGGVFAITSELTLSGSAQKGRGKVVFTGDASTFSGNTASRVVRSQNVGNDICATSSNSDEGNGAVIEINTLPSTFSGSPGCDIGIDRSILVLGSGVTLGSATIFNNRETTCGYTYNSTTLTFTSLSSDSGLNKWRIYWDGVVNNNYTDYSAGGTDLPSHAVSSGTAVLIKGYTGAREMAIYYMIPSSNASAASQALFDDALFDDAEVFEGLAPQSSALDDYCDECYL